MADLRTYPMALAPLAFARLGDDGQGEEGRGRNSDRGVLRMSRTHSFQEFAAVLLASPNQKLASMRRAPLGVDRSGKTDIVT